MDEEAHITSEDNRGQVWAALTCVPENENRKVPKTDRSLPREGIASLTTGLRVEDRKPAIFSVHQMAGEQGKKALTQITLDIRALPIMAAVVPLSPGEGEEGGRGGSQIVNLNLAVGVQIASSEQCLEGPERQPLINEQSGLVPTTFETKQDGALCSVYFRD